jgi:O-antigen biosynthesis protein
VHGGYQRSEITALAKHYGITDWLIPSIWPETFSYTTHEAIATGLPVWGFDLGAQGQAIRAHNRGGVIPIPGGKPDIDAFLAALVHPQTESAAA